MVLATTSMAELFHSQGTAIQATRAPQQSAIPPYTRKRCGIGERTSAPAAHIAHFNHKRKERRLRRAPWDLERLKINPEQFERIVVKYLRSLHSDLKDFSVRHRVPLTGPDGEFELDALARFEALGAEFLVVVECKHHRNPIKREVVQVLRDRIRSIGAHKGMLFSTGGFQSGAIEYALSQKIALVHFTAGGPVYATKGWGQPDGPMREYDAYSVSLNENGTLFV
jgi:restriction system protein